MKPASSAPWLSTFCCMASYSALVLFAVASVFGHAEMAVVAGIAVLCYINTERLKR